MLSRLLQQGFSLSQHLFDRAVGGTYRCPAFQFQQVMTETHATCDTTCETEQLLLAVQTLEGKQAVRKYDHIDTV